MAEAAEQVRELYRLARRGSPEEVIAMIDPDATWHGVNDDAWKPCANGDEVVRTLMWRANALRWRVGESIGVGDQVVIGIRGMKTRRYGAKGPFAPKLFQLVTVRRGRVVAIRDYPRRQEALEAAGLQRP